ncbi:MAG: hypothetical protein H6609_17080 [Ignavibacteriales bacterium]|nr:hypothetical protein [Ignavibacteriales bacterium]
MEKLQSEEEYNYENGKKLVSKIMKDDEGNKYTTKINFNENKTESDLLFKTNNETEIRLEIIYEEKHRKKSVTLIILMMSFLVEQFHILMKIILRLSMSDLIK